MKKEKTLLVQIYDKLTTQLYLPTFVTEKQITRYILSFIYNEMKTNLGFKPEDYELWAIGEYNENETVEIYKELSKIQIEKVYYDHFLKEDKK